MRAVNLLPRDDRAKRTAAENAPAYVGLGLLLVVAVALSVMFLGASASVKDKRNALGAGHPGGRICGSNGQPKAGDRSD